MIHLPHKKIKIAKGFVVTLGVLGTVFYPILIDPFLDPEKYKDVQRETRKNIKREDIQPGNMNIWRNPFDVNPKTGEQKQ